MNKKATDQLKQLMTELLPGMNVLGGKLDIVHAIDHLRPLSEFVELKFGELLTEAGAFSHLFFNVADSVESDEFVGSGRLGDLLAPPAINHLIDEVVLWWGLVPRKYVFNFPLPALTLPNWHESVAIAEGITLKAPPIGGENSSSRRNALAAILSGISVPTSWSLQVEASGLARFGSEGESASASAIRTAKQTLILAQLQGVFSEREVSSPPPKTFVGKDMTQGVVEIVPTSLPIALGKVLASAALEDKLRTAPAGLLSSLGGAPTRDRLPSEVAEELGKRLAAVGAVILRAKQHGPAAKRAGANSVIDDEDNLNRHCARIVTAAEWLLDAEMESSKAMAYVQASIGFEALHGGGKKDPVVQTLANRVAYALGRNVGDREGLKKRFTEFYDKRSDIVHNGSTHLDLQELGLFNWAKHTLRRALRHELSLLGPIRG